MLYSFHRQIIPICKVVQQIPTARTVRAFSN